MADASAPLPDSPVVAGAIISEQVVVKGVFGTQQSARINADARREYVASRSNIWGTYTEGIRSLPHSIDDITNDLGYDIYERMSYDPQVASLSNTLKAAVLSQAVVFKSPIIDDIDPNYKLAQTLKAYFEECFENMEPDANVVWDNMLDAITLGNKIAEKVYRPETIGPFAGKFMLQKIAVKHRSSLYFVIDKFGNIAGFSPTISGDGKLGSFNIGVFDPKNNELIPRTKFAYFAFRPKDGDPRGTSILRPAYNAWWLKMQTWPELLRYLSLFGSPGVIGFTSPDSRPTPMVNDDGDMVGTESPEQVMLIQLEAWRSGAVAAFPSGAVVQFLEAQGNGEAFLRAVELLNREISKGVTGQELATGEGTHQARAASEVHQDILELVITFIKQIFCTMIYKDIILPSILINWGEEALIAAPVPSLGKVQKQDKAALMAAYVTAGWETDPSQWQGVDAELDVPPRDPESIKRAVEMAQVQLDTAKNPPKAPAISGGGTPPPTKTAR